MWNVMYTRPDGYLEFEKFKTWDDAMYHADFVWGTEQTFEIVSVYKT